MVNDSHRLHSRQVVGGFPGAAANDLLEEKQPPPQMSIDVDMEMQLKGQRIMDALLGFYTTKENAEEIKKDNSLGSLASLPQRRRSLALPAPSNCPRPHPHIDIQFENNQTKHL